MMALTSGIRAFRTRLVPGALVTAVVALAGLAAAQPARAQTTLGYYRYPAIHDSTIVFTAEGDLWTVGLDGGVARRLTTGLPEETHAAISPDGRTIAFTAEYEGPTEVYTMPLAGGLPRRWTWDGGPNDVVGWTPDGHILFTTRDYSTLPNNELVALDTTTDTRTVVPLAQAADGAYDGATLFFTRLAFQGSHTRRYKGGSAQQLWRWTRGEREATPLTANYAGTSKVPMIWDHHVYFASDRDGVMNLWSMDETGHALHQLTHHTDYNLQSPSLSDGRIVYQLGADLWVYDIRTGQDRRIPIRLASDFDQMRVRWITDPMKWVTSVHLSPTGDRVVLTARGQVFIAPVVAGQGRLVKATRDRGVRYRDARFMPNGDTLITLSDETGEVELWTLPADGVGRPEQLTHNGTVLRWEAIPSPDGRHIAHTDKDQRLWVYDVATKHSRLVASSDYSDFGDLAWSPDSRWLAYDVVTSENGLERIFVYDTRTHAITAVTSDRYDSYSPAWSPNGKWLWLLSDRNFQSLVGSPWGSRAPQPFFDHQTVVYGVALEPGERFPFAPADELHPDTTTGAAPAQHEPTARAARTGRGSRAGRASSARESRAAGVVVRIDATGLMTRLHRVPLTPGNYSSLRTDGRRLYLLSAATNLHHTRALEAVEITRRKPEAKTLVPGVRSYELSANGKKLLVRKGEDLYVLGAGTHPPAKLAEAKVDLSGWKFAIDPREEWGEMYREAWRLERDYFYDTHMNGIDWPAMKKKYQPLADRVTDREELSDVLGQMIAELSALHMFVFGGDMRSPAHDIHTASLGAVLHRDVAGGGWRVAHIYVNDPDLPADLSPLTKAGVHDGDVITAVDGRGTLAATSVDQLLQDQAGKQVRLTIKPHDGGTPHAVIVEPISTGQAANLRYDEWEYTRRLLVDSLSGGRIGYVHLRAMGTSDMNQFERDFYPDFAKQALIFDDRNNRGGNIDSWILERLARRAWMYWQPRIGKPSWNMQEAFRGPMVTLINEHTASDGEAFAYGFRALGLGKLIGTRTWGGEIWLSFSNLLVDRGIASSAQLGVYGPNGKWLIEGHGVDPDTVVDNSPHETFAGNDAQLRAAVAYLLQELKEHPVTVPKHPPYPNKSWHGGHR